VANNEKEFSNESRENLTQGSFVKDTNIKDNEFVHTPADDVNETETNEAKKAENTKAEDFEKFNVDKADELNDMKKKGR